MMVAELVLAALVILVASLLALVLSHFLPVLLNPKAPRGSFGWPLLGETLRFLSPHASNMLGSFLEDRCSRYGRVFKSHLFCTPTVVSCDQDLNHFILQNEERLFQCSYPRSIHGILGKSSMLVVLGEDHKRLRNLSLALVTSTKLKSSYLGDVEKIALHVVGAWRHGKSNDDGSGARVKVVAFCEEARKFAFSVIVKQVLGLSTEEPVTASILEDFLAFMKGLISFPLYIPGTSYAKAVQARERISNTVKGIIEERRSAGSCKKGDFLDVLLASNELSDEEKVSFVLDSLLGGYETTSLLISMVVYFLGQSAKDLDLVKREHDIIRSSKGKEECLTSDDYKKMEYTQQVINEALRCGNIVKFVHRKALKDVRYKEYLIPSGWKVLPVFSAVHLNPSLHGNAQQFQPCRWEGSSQGTSKKFTPFGGGPRLCPGSELAKVEAAFFLHHLVLNYRWRIDGDDIPMAYPYVEFQRGLPIEIEPLCPES
ncbi:cytochrome P450 724B1-like [Phragmites australis]|uniref:cytochrome P450 724B1-like n=1 Tax=Phragmites australis TaxID=29695 RepID=UPI002D78CC9B|nr:cytochrome P450 724B1-like [Phragmites australis]